MKRFVDEIKKRWKALTLVILTTITVFSLLPLDALPPAPGTDKTHHFIAYAMLMLPTALRKPANWVILGLFFILYSGAIELIQPFINRYGEWMDIFANSGGVICGAIIAWLINFKISAKHAKQSVNNS
ncbi:VanZ family protein [Desulfobacter hydrogenophilus]|uniref:VanZ family protein n=1 Tax=Desulfobacter hydrogenophilus TaxID=2291 RepID=A0A328FKH8_9BACT|nr:VanZ family protein [Desulfobacter hydrogenophilus]NDY71373.1 VanZ family protein [Desulfobacter hydrogenophilus]QBH12229.1 VanZ family protein [Desulfobacter hydrogenophilus]RAM03445.1 VanZ family protein [Desulfobacter hydrogenophilus]